MEKCPCGSIHKFRYTKNQFSIHRWYINPPFPVWSMSNWCWYQSRCYVGYVLDAGFQVWPDSFHVGYRWVARGELIHQCPTWGLNIKLLALSAVPGGISRWLHLRQLGLFLLTWININPSMDHMPSKVCDEITYPFPNFNGCKSLWMDK